jgi:hypothetical protein
MTTEEDKERPRKSGLPSGQRSQADLSIPRP